MFTTALLMTIQLLTANSLDLTAQPPPNPAGRGGSGVEQPAQPSERQSGRRGGGAGPAAPDAPELIRIYPVKHLNCQQVCEIVAQAFGRPHLYPINVTNSVLYAGPEALAPRIEELISQLDTPAAGEEVVSEADVELVPIKHRDAEEIAWELARINLPHNFQAVHDPSRNAVLMKGEKQVIAKARQIIDGLDAPSPMVQLEFVFFRARQQGGGGEEIPEDLRGLSKELQRFGQVELLGRLSTLAVQDRRFRIHGHVSELLTARVEGHLLSAGDDGSAKVQFEASMDLAPPSAEPAAPSSADAPPAPRKPRPPEFFLNTVVTTRRGDQVVLGSAPHGWGPGESAILVLTVRK